MNTFTDGAGNKLHNVHDPVLCEGYHCPVHNPSVAATAIGTLVWRDGGMFDVKPSHFERVCEHGVGHPDPDALDHRIRLAQIKEIAGDQEAMADAQSMGVHGCDGCCQPSKEAT